MLKILFLEGTQFIMKTLDSSLKIGKVSNLRIQKKLEDGCTILFPKILQFRGDISKVFSATDP